MVNAYACTSTVGTVTPCLIGSALVESGCLWLRLVLHQKRLNPVVVAPLTNSISDRGGLFRHLKALAEGLSEPLQSRAGKAPNGVEDLLDCAWIERVKAWIFLLLRR